MTENWTNNGQPYFFVKKQFILLDFLYQATIFSQIHFPDPYFQNSVWRQKQQQ